MTIRNTATGEMRTIDSSQATQYGIGGSQLQQQMPNQQPGEATIAKTGLFDIPVLGGLLRGAENSTESYGRMVGGAAQEALRSVGQAGARAGSALQGKYDPNAQTPLTTNPNMFLSQADLGTMGSSPAEGLGRTVNMMMTASAAKGLPSTIKSIPTAISLSTKKGASNLATKAAGEATDQGQAVHWDDIAKRIKDNVLSKYGQTPEVKNSLNELLAEKTPAGVESLPETMQMNPSNLLDWRRQISARGGTSFIDRIMKGSDVGSKVEGEARRTISQMVHELAPGTITPDKFYSAYSKLHGDVPSWATKIVGGAILDQLAGGKIKGLLSGL